MEIKNIQNYYKVQAANAQNLKRTAEENNTPAAGSRAADTVDISAEASFKAEMSKKARANAVNGSEKTSGARIAELKQKYQGDTCPVSGSDIAKKIIDCVLGQDSKD